MKALNNVKELKSAKNGLKLQLPANEYRSIPIPGVSNAKLGICFVKVTDIPGALDTYMEINPRVPSRNKAGILSGPVAKGIMSTLRDTPEEMVLKNQGIYILAENTSFNHNPGGVGLLTVGLTDPGKHGIINGGHTYAAIREAIESANEDELKALDRAYVRLHIFQNIDEDFVPEIAEGLNRSKQVDDPSLVNLQGQFDIIRKALKGVKGSESVAYHQGDEGEIYISELLVMLNLFNIKRFDEKKHPNGLYNRQALGLKYFTEDLENDPKDTAALIDKLPDIMWLADSIRKAIPAAARNNNFKFGQAKMSAVDRAGALKHKGIKLPFLGEIVNYRVPNGWVYPILAAFRANLKEVEGGKLEWRVPLQKVLADTIDDLTSVCVAEHRDNNMRPELIGKREGSYGQCYTKMQLYLAKKGLL